MILVRYVTEGKELTLEYPEERLDELLQRADARFLPEWTGEDEMRFQAIHKKCLSRLTRRLRSA